jgi:hypothetical protein
MTKEVCAMRKAIAIVLGPLLVILGLAGAGLAQSGVQVQGTIQSVDCQSQTVVLNGSGGSNTLTVGDSTAVLVNSASVPFCTLQQYVGSPATAWLLPTGNEFEVTQIDVTGPASASPTVSSPSTLELVLGAIAVAGLGYLIGHSTSQPPVVYPSGYPYYPGYAAPQYVNRVPRCGGGTWNQWSQRCEVPNHPSESK